MTKGIKGEGRGEGVHKEVNFGQVRYSSQSALPTAVVYTRLDTSCYLPPSLAAAWLNLEH